MTQDERMQSKANPIGTTARRLGTLALLCVAAALAGPAQAADEPQKLPAVTVTGEKNPAATPVEVAYTDSTFTKLGKASRYPSSREASLDRPSGTAKVWVEVQRSGKVVGHGLESPSGSKLLDQAAINLATRAKYAPLPADAWTGEAKHRFVVSYAFDGAAMTAGKKK